MIRMILMTALRLYMSILYARQMLYYKRPACVCVSVNRTYDTNDRCIYANWVKVLRGAKINTITLDDDDEIAEAALIMTVITGHPDCHR